MNILNRKKIDILIHLAEADGDYHPIEKSFILKVAERHGISESEVEEIKEAHEPIGSLGALSYNTSIDYLTDVLLLLPVDGKILPSEIVFCQDIALRLGFRKSGVDKLIKYIEDTDNVNPDDLSHWIRKMPHLSRP